MGHRCSLARGVQGRGFPKGFLGMQAEAGRATYAPGESNELGYYWVKLGGSHSKSLRSDSRPEGDRIA